MEARLSSENKRIYLQSAILSELLQVPRSPLGRSKILYWQPTLSQMERSGNYESRSHFFHSYITPKLQEGAALGIIGIHQSSFDRTYAVLTPTMIGYEVGEEIDIAVHVPEITRALVRRAHLAVSEINSTIAEEWVFSLIKQGITWKQSGKVVVPSIFVDYINSLT